MQEERKEWPVNAKGLTFDPVQERITIFRTTIEAIGTPEYYRFLFNPTRKKFAIQACAINDEGAEKMPKLRDGDCCYVRSALLVRYVFDTCSWNRELTHRVEGVLRPEQKLVEYDLTRSWELRWAEV